MIINRLLLEEGKTVHYSEDIDFSKDNENLNNLLKKIDDCHVEVDVTDYVNILRVIINLKANVTGICAYSLEDVPLVVKTNDELDFTDDEDYEDDEDLIYITSPKIDLKNYIYSLICASLPSKIIKKGATLPKDGKGYRVLTEEDFIKEKESKPDPRWACLDDIEL